ncbi:hypothetical protein EH31_02780 [Erythrobacter longus]|uniref:Uncharacterized protein n=2 Tax=Erythrobacter longus TaxID=1044 RepID=A0A074MIG3_ERYLO|nr:hypothetical protein EH31_02780 [Erythrobacter longus]
MLFLIGIHPDRPGDVELVRHAALYASMEDCEADGAKLAAQRTETQSESSGVQYTARCIVFPDREEYSELLKRTHPALK